MCASPICRSAKPSGIPSSFKGEQGAERVHVSNVRLFDAGQQFLKSTVDYAAALNGVDDVIVENSLIEFTVIGPPDGYTEGIDVHHGANWIIRNNVFRNFRVPAGATYVNRPGVLMWGGSRNTTVYGNTFINCERAIIFGQGGAGGSATVIPAASSSTTSSTGRSRSTPTPAFRSGTRRERASITTP